MLLLRNADQLICTSNSVKWSYWWLLFCPMWYLFIFSLYCKCFGIMFWNNIWHFVRYCAYLLDNRTVHFHLSIPKSGLSMVNTYCNHVNVNCIACMNHTFIFYIKSAVVGRNSFEMCQNIITIISWSADEQYIVSALMTGSHVSFLPMMCFFRCL